MSQTVVKHLPILKLIADTKNLKLRKQLLKQCCNRSLINAITECCWNLLNGRVPLSINQKSRLSKNKAVIRAIANKNVSIKKRGNLLQSGGFIRLLPFLLGPIISTVTSLFKKK